MKISPDQITTLTQHLLTTYQQQDPRDNFWEDQKGNFKFTTSSKRYEDLAAQIDHKEAIVKASWLRQLFTKYRVGDTNVEIHQAILDKCCQYLNGQSAQQYFFRSPEPQGYYEQYSVWWAGSVSNADIPLYTHDFDITIEPDSVELITLDQRRYVGGKPDLLNHKLHLALTNRAATERVFFILHVGEADQEELECIPGVFSSGDTANTNPCAGPVLFIRKGLNPDEALLKMYFDDFKGNSLIKTWTISDILEARRKLGAMASKPVVGTRSNNSIIEKQQLLYNQVFYLYYYKTFEDIHGREDGVGRAVLRFGDNLESVTVEAWAEGKTITYSGFYYLVTPQTLSLSFRTQTHERDLSLKFRIGTGQIYPFTLGVFSNFGNQGEPVAGTALLQHINATEPVLSSTALRKSDKEYLNVHSNIRRFFSNRRMNLLNTRVKGIFTHADFATFFKEQEGKKFTSRPIIPGQTRIFIASPMSSQVEDFEEIRPVILEIIQNMKDKGISDVYYAGKEYDPNIGFSLTSYFAAQIDFRALENTDHLFIVHPRRVASSSLVEIGFALGQGKMCHVFYKDRKDLPFILRELQQPNVLYYSFENVGQLPGIVTQILDDLSI